VWLWLFFKILFIRKYIKTIFFLFLILVQQNNLKKIKAKKKIIFLKNIFKIKKQTGPKDKPHHYTKNN